MPNTMRRQSGWIRFERATADERVRLFCFPHAGGGASAYIPWKPLTPDHIGLFPVQLPGHEERYGERAVRDMHEMCARLAEGLEPYFTGQMAFFGHSMGGLLAFCFARHLVREGLPAPVHLFLSAAPTPILPEPIPERLSALDEEAFMQSVLRANEVPEAVLHDADSMEVVRRTFFEDHALLRTMLDNSREALDIPVSVFAGESDPLVPLERIRLWKEFTRGVCSLSTFPGGHFYLRAHLGEVIGQISQSLLMYSL